MNRLKIKGDLTMDFKELKYTAECKFYNFKLRARYYGKRTVKFVRENSGAVITAAPVIIAGVKLTGRVADKVIHLKRRTQIYDPSGRVYVRANRKQMHEFKVRHRAGERPSQIIRDMGLE